MAEALKNAVLLAFNPKTGHIDSTVSGAWPEGHEVFKRPNTIIADGHIQAVQTVVDSYGKSTDFETLVTSGWTLLLNDKGEPQVDADGGLMISPPQPGVPNPDIHTYNFLANIKAGHIDPQDVHPDVIRDVNHQLAKIGKPIIPGTQLLPLPVHTAKTRSKKI